MRRKALSPLVSYILLVLLVLTGLGMATDISTPIFEGAKDTQALSAARESLTALDHEIQGTAGYGEGSSTTHSLSLQQGGYTIQPAEDSITYTLHTDAEGLTPGASVRFGNVFMQVSNETGRKAVRMKINYTSIDITGNQTSLREGVHRLTITNRGSDGERTRVEVVVE